MTLPTPFTAEEIRLGCPDGRTVRVREEHTDTVTVTSFVRGDLEGATLETWTEGPHGVPVDDVTSTRVLWVTLQMHAAFPAASSTVRSQNLSTPLGELSCLRYDVGPRTFWFDRNRPGMPVRYGSGTSWWQMIGDTRS